MIGNLFSLLLGATSLVRVTFVGELPVMEILMAIFAPIIIARQFPKMRSNFVRIFFWGGLAWLLAQVLSDWYNQTAATNAARGLANIGMSLLGFFTFYALFVGHENRYRWFLLGTIPSAVYFVMTGGTTPSELVLFQENTEWWDIFIAPLAAPTLLLLASILVRRFPRLTVLGFLIYGVAAVVEQSRAHGLVFAVTGILYLLAARQLSLQTNVRRIALWVSPLLIIGFIAYVRLGLQGNLGHKTQTQLVSLNQPYNPLYVLLGGRTELLVALDAIADKPLLGHGSWANDPKYFSDYARRAAELGGEETARGINADDIVVIPAHSVIFGTWVFGGIVAGLFWLWVAWRCIGLVPMAIASGPSPATILVLNFAVISCWILLFSPVGAVRGAWAAGLAFSIITMIDRRAIQNATDGYSVPHANSIPDRTRKFGTACT